MRIKVVDGNWQYLCSECGKWTETGLVFGDGRVLCKEHGRIAKAKLCLEISHASLQKSRAMLSSWRARNGR